MPKQIDQNHRVRISILDGFRAIAIIPVILFHYFSRWTPPTSEISLYPYGSAYDYFGWGALGVQFFFIISGFVIYFTLERTKNMASFWKKRMIRLLPSIIIASLITFIVFVLFDRDNIFPASHSIKNFIPSILFVNPYLLNNIFNTDFEYISGCYWSLWPEIQFYFLTSCLYYLNKKRFVINLIIVSIVLILVNAVMQNVQGSNLLNIELPKSIIVWYNTWIAGGFNLVLFLPFFSIGAIFYVLYRNNKENIRTSIFLKMCILFIIAYIAYSGHAMSTRLLYILMIALFFVFVYFPDKLSIFENKKITDIGESSYFLYLIHENVGVFIIYSLGRFVFPDLFITPLIVIIVLCYLSVLFTSKIDKPLNSLLKKKI